jgi:hypothetical protein
VVAVKTPATAQIYADFGCGVAVRQDIIADHIDGLRHRQVFVAGLSRGGDAIESKPLLDLESKHDRS